MTLNPKTKLIFKKDKINIAFFGKLNLSNGSDRIFCHTFSKFLDKLEDCNSEEIKNIPDKINCDIAIFKKNFPLKILKKFSKENKHLLIGIINPSDKNDGLRCIKLADFAIVGSVEEKAYYSRYIKCFIYPLIEEVDEKYIRDFSIRPKKQICYHGNKQHIDFININLEKALLRLNSEGYRFKAIYDFKGLGKCKKKFITEHIQWEKDTWLNEIADSTVGICPTTHYPGLIRNSLAKFISRNRTMRNDYVLQYKNTSNASRAFIFHQLKIPVITEIGGSMHHILGDEKCGYICYSENSWYSSIKRICMDDNLNKEFSEKAYYLMKNLYDPKKWCERFINEIRYWIKNDY